MPALFVFLLKVNIALLLFCAGYYLVLRHLTFYTLNRVYLLAAILFASIYPEINLSAFAQRHQELVKPVQHVIIYWSQAPVATPDYWYYAEIIFWLGALVLTLQLAMQLFSLFKLYKSSRPEYINDHLVRVMDKDAAPFSFWRSIYVNPDKHEPADLKAIILHEQVHVSQWHTADILLAEISSIFYWFNPGIWLIKRAVKENVEFITDQKILKNGIDTKSYQYSLISVSLNNNVPAIVNNFNLKTIKNRIIMMNKEQSSKLNLTRYAFIVPAVIALSLVFTISKADFAKPVKANIIKAVKPLTAMITAEKKAGQTKKVIIEQIKAATKMPKAAPDSVKTNRVKIIYKNVIFDAHNPPFPDTHFGIVVSDYPDSTIVIKRPIINDSTKIIINGKTVAKDSLIYGSGKHYDFYMPDHKSTALNESKTVGITPSIVIIDGKKYSPSEVSKLNIATINSITVFNNASAKSLYGLSSENGVVVITTKKHETTDKPKTISQIIPAGINGNELYIVDGKEVSKAEFYKTDPIKLETISILKDASATAIYGDKGKNGVIMATTKKDKEKQ